ncbi:hypothetical protein V6L77_12340 [Pannonibacter sp. Pt2-lr]
MSATGFEPLFLAHGSPMLAIADSAAHRFLKELGPSLPRPRAIVVLSPHWETEGLRVSAPARCAPSMISAAFPAPCSRSSIRPAPRKM